MPLVKARLVEIPPPSKSQRDRWRSEGGSEIPEVDTSALPPRLAELILAGSSTGNDAMTLSTTRKDSGLRAQLSQDPSDAVSDVRFQLMKQRIPVHQSHKPSISNLPALSEEDSAWDESDDTSSEIVSPVSSLRTDDTTPLSLLSPPLFPSPKSIVAESDLRLQNEFHRRLTAIAPAAAQAIAQANPSVLRPVSTRTVSTGCLSDPTVAMAQMQNLMPVNGSMFLGRPRESMFSLHSYGSLPELPTSARRSRHKSIQTLTTSQILDPNFQLFDNGFDRLSLAVAASRRVSRAPHVEHRATQSETQATLRPQPVEVGHNGLRSERSPRAIFAEFFQEVKHEVKFGFHAPCVTPSGAPSPLPLCARPDGVDQLLHDLESRNKRLWWWRGL